MNKVIISGNLTKNPEFSILGSGKRRCVFSVASTRKFKNKDGIYEADFVSCVSWDHTADFIRNYFNKGNSIEVEGWLRVDRYEDEAGKTQWRTSVVVEYAGFCGKKSNTSGRKTDGESYPPFEYNPEMTYGSPKSEDPF